MKKDTFVDILLLILAIINFFGGLYISIRYMLVGGIVDIVAAYKMDSPNEWMIAWGFAKVFFTLFPISISYLISFILFTLMLRKKSY